jgi:hypothetical protein
MIVYIVRTLAADEDFGGKHRDMLTEKTVCSAGMGTKQWLEYLRDRWPGKRCSLLSLPKWLHESNVRIIIYTGRFYHD